MTLPKLRFRLWHLLLFIFVVCCVAATYRGRQQKHVASFIRDHGGYVVYEHRKYEYDWNEVGAAENHAAERNHPYSAWQQTLLDPNHYNSVVGVRFGSVMLESMEDAEKYGFLKMLQMMERDFERDGPMIVPFNDIDDNVFQELLAELRKLPKLQLLGLENSQMTDKYILELAQFKNLRQLELFYCRKLTPQAVEELRTLLPDCEIKFEAP